MNSLTVMATTKAKLLIVDDEPVIVDLIARNLSDFGYEIRKAYDGQEAVSIAQEFQPDCVITGYMMPRMNGLQEAAAILQFQPNCKFVFHTGSSHLPEVREEYRRLGLDLSLLLPKPFKMIDLRNALALAGFPCSVG